MTAAARCVALVAALLLAIPAMVSAQDRFITDELGLDLRTGPGNQYRIERMVPAGTRVEVMDEASGWSQVRLPDGLEGWVLTRMLTDQPSARVRLSRSESALENVQQENSELEESLAAAEARVEELEQRLGTSESERETLEQRMEQAEQGLDLYEENEELKKRVIDLQRELQDVEQERERLRDRDDQRWFIVGASVLGAGILAGLILPHMRWRRRSSWGGGGL
ncbi:TIGR04211 family SH3 domain-containing protein [Aquisalimonas asiatica]|uniref:SH3 domain protein n=1 Tax=Aquisalimonas asiatica TaxID=406100 RepID=A0A1H8TR84_9GAMM|nr:TIGR04211 family SH3 domain-containing protein [Aquisalimonas asiatica]SEO93381.1 SH3 domain protein [Aquisalimonas asiatica]